MEFRILGPIEVCRDGEPVGMRSGRSRSLLALLLARAPHPVTVDSAIELLWTEPPGSAKAQVHNMISALRRTADNGLIVSRGASYRAELGANTLDLAEFRTAAAEGRRAMARGEHELAITLLAGALDWWRGPALADAVEPLAGTVAAALDAERVTATETLLDAELAAGRYEAALDTAGALLAEHAYREDLYARKLRALCGLGRRTDALEVYQQARRRLVDDLGVEPGRELRELHARILDGGAVVGGPGTPPRARAEPPAPAQLPPTVERLFGREALLAGIRTALADARVAPAVVVLTGQGGIGKSALATHAGHLLAAEFPGGQLYADLRGSRDTPACAHEVAGRFLRSFGMPGSEVATDPDERVGQLRSELAGRRLLIVLDDARDDAQVRPLLPGSASCAVVITSRRRLDALAGAVTHVVPTLSSTAAQQLLTDASGSVHTAPGTAADETRDTQVASGEIGDAQGAGSAGNAQVAPREPGDAGGEVARLCGYLPLAIRIAGARLAARPDWTVERLRVRLARQRTRLNELSIGDLDVRASIALSYRTLPEEQRVTLRRLGLLDATDLPAWVPAALADAPDGGDSALDGLVGCHLVEYTGTDQAEQPRFRLHDLVHEFARERAAAEDPDPASRAAVERVLDGWLALATEADQFLGLERPSPSPMREGPHLLALPAARGRSYDWFEAERGNLVAAVHRAVALGDPQRASELTVRTSGFLQVRNYLTDREAITRAAIECRERHGLRDHRLVEHLNGLFRAFGQGDDVERMAEVAERLLCLASELGDGAARVDATEMAASVAQRQGRLGEALRLSHRCADESVLLGLPERQIATARWGLALSLAEIGEPAEAVALFRPVVTGGEIGGRSRAIVLADFAEALVELGQLDEAAAALAEAGEIVARIGDELGAGRIRVFAADVAMARRDWPGAHTLLEPALEALTRLDNSNGRIYALRRLGDVALGEGRPDRATRHHEHALRLARGLGALVEAARALARLAIAANLSGRPDQAGRHHRECHAILADLDLPTTCLRLPAHLRQLATHSR